MSSKPKDLTGNKYGRLSAVQRLERSPNAGYFWKCLCDCGKETKVTIGNLQSGHVLSCGCLRNEISADIHRTHGMTGTKEYKCWVKMRERCLSVNDKEYPNYGAVGVLIQENWVKSFSDFIGYMGLHPNDGHKYSIDRLENDLGYCEGNVRWATTFEQARNKTKLKINTSGKTGVQWEDKIWPDGINSTLYCKAIWNNLQTGKQCKKSFSVKTYGLLPAFKLACEYRDKMIAELNSQGAGYTEHHGK